MSSLHSADWVPPGEDGAATPTTTTGTPDGAKHDGLDSCVTMVQERLLEALLLAPAATAKATVPTEEHVPSSSLPRLPTAEEDSGRSAPVSMDVEGEEGEPSGMTTVAEGGITVGLDPTTGKSDVPTAVQVVASMVDSALQVWKMPHISFAPPWADDINTKTGPSARHFRR